MAVSPQELQLSGSFASQIQPAEKWQPRSTISSEPAWSKGYLTKSVLQGLPHLGQADRHSIEEQCTQQQGPDYAW